MKRKIRYRTRDLLRVRLVHARRIYREHLAYEPGVIRKIKKFPRVTSSIYNNRFYIDVEPFYTTRYDNER